MHTREEMERLQYHQQTRHLFFPRIVEEVRSIRFNQEQEDVIMHKHASKSLTFLGDSSPDIRDMATKQDLITALASREKVRVPFPS